MGGCLTTSDPTTITESSAQEDEHSDEKQIESHANDDQNHSKSNNNTKSSNHDDDNAHHKKECDGSDIYCAGSDWLKFPICCRYCSNHREPSQEFQLVILGPGYTGKTTLRHHLVQRYGHAFCKADFLMYRDILQHNVLDLFRDLLSKPSLTFKELKQFIKYIHKHKQSHDGDRDSVITDIDHELLDNIHIVSPELSPELDLGLHDLSEDDDLEMVYKFKQQIYSHSSSLRSLDLEAEGIDDEDEEEEKAQMDILLNEMMMNDMAADAEADAYTKMSNNKYKTPFSSPMIKAPLPSPVAIDGGGDEFKIMESPQSLLCTPHSPGGDSPRYDGNKYCVLNQCSPTSTTHNVTFDRLPSASVSPTPTTGTVLNPSVLSLKLDAVTHDQLLCTKGTTHVQQQYSSNTCTDNTKAAAAPTKWRPLNGAICSLLNTFKPQTQRQQSRTNCNDDDNGREERKQPETEAEAEEEEEEEAQHEMLSISQLIDKLSCEQLKYGRDNGRYLILNSDRILSDRFEPTFIDLLQCHVRSTGLMFENHVICRSLPINKWPNDTKQDVVFRVVDVGGHRNERKKWSYVLKQDNDVIVFVVSAASFCQVLFEDFKKNAMRESIAVWKDIISSAAATAAASGDHTAPQFILVINKIDLFYQRCHLFKEYFTEYTGDCDNKYEILNYIKSLYLDIARQYAPQHNVHCVVTQLTDTLEIASSDVHQIKHILLNHESIPSIHKDIVDTIIDYAIGDVFWSEKWLKPMWERKNGCSTEERSRRSLSAALCTNNKQAICDHINNPHDYHHHQHRRRKKKHKHKKSKRNTIVRMFSR